jgi:hypothetical protein
LRTGPSVESGGIIVTRAIVGSLEALAVERRDLER